MKNLLKYFLTLLFVVSTFFFHIKAKAEHIDLKYSIFFPPTHPQTKVAINWAKELEKKSGGKVRIVIIPGDSLLNPRECYDGVKSGIVDIAFGSFVYTPGRFPVMGVMELPFGIPSGIVASQVADQFAKELHPKELSDVKVLYLHATGPTYLYTRKPIQNIDTMKNLKLLDSYQSTEIISALGASSVRFPMPEAYMAIKQGSIDGLFATKSNFKLLKLSEVVPYTINTSVIGNTATMFVVMNKSKWDSLPPDLQNLFEKISEAWVMKHGEEWDKLSEDTQYYAKSGHKFIELSKNDMLRLQEIVMPIFENYKKRIPNGREYIRKIEDLIIKTSRRKCPSGYYNCNTNKCCKKKSI